MSKLEEVLASYDAGPTDGVFTDGGCEPNPGAGGWGYVYVKNNQIIYQASGHEPNTTNNRMELTAIISALEYLPADIQTDLYSDSNLCVQTLNTWAKDWSKRGWRRKTGAIANLDLVQRAYSLALERPGVRIKWIKAHNGWRWNEYADALASAWNEQP